MGELHYNLAKAAFRPAAQVITACLHARAVQGSVQALFEIESQRKDPVQVWRQSIVACRHRHRRRSEVTTNVEGENESDKSGKEQSTCRFPTSYISVI